MKYEKTTSINGTLSVREAKTIIAAHLKNLFGTKITSIEFDKKNLSFRFSGNNTTLPKGRYEYLSSFKLNINQNLNEFFKTLLALHKRKSSGPNAMVRLKNSSYFLENDHEKRAEMTVKQLLESEPSANVRNYAEKTHMEVILIFEKLGLKIGSYPFLKKWWKEL